MANVKRSPWLLHYDGSSCNGCDIEVLACMTPVYDAERLGVENTGDPMQLIIFDIYENNAYAIQQELKRKYPKLDLVTLIGSVRNTNRVNWVLRKYKPEVVYHAAAHKHVPLMEDSPNEAIKNNCQNLQSGKFCL